jgi:hypothetical protein
MASPGLSFIASSNRNPDPLAIFCGGVRVYPVRDRSVVNPHGRHRQ